MAKILTITAVSGWALPKKWFATQVATAFPGSRVEVVYPVTPDNPEEAEILLERYPADLYVGYSLGSLWLLKYRNLLPETAIKALLAPFLSFLKKDGLGGTTSETQLTYLSRALTQNPDKHTIIKNFFSYSNLPVPETFIEDVPDNETLLRGLEFLKSSHEKGEATKIFLSIVGENDIFIDGEVLRRHIPHLEIIQGVGHSPGKLLEHLASRLNWKTDNI
jgi:hypothetical protein